MTVNGVNSYDDAASEKVPVTLREGTAVHDGVRFMFDPGALPRISSFMAVECFLLPHCRDYPERTFFVCRDNLFLVQKCADVKTWLHRTNAVSPRVRKTFTMPCGILIRACSHEPCVRLSQRTSLATMTLALSCTQIALAQSPPSHTSTGRPRVTFRCGRALRKMRSSWTLKISCVCWRYGQYRRELHVGRNSLQYICASFHAAIVIITFVAIYRGVYLWWRDIISNAHIQKHTNAWRSYDTFIHSYYIYIFRYIASRTYVHVGIEIDGNDNIYIVSTGQYIYARSKILRAETRWP